MGSLRFMMTGNFSHMVSYPAWHHCVSPSQETFRIWFLIRHGTIAFHLHRKLSAYGFLSGMAPLRFTFTGNFPHMVSIRHDTIAFHLSRKLL